MRTYSRPSSISLTIVSDGLTDEKVLLIFAWRKGKRDHYGLIDIWRSLDLNRFRGFPENFCAGNLYRSNAGDVISAGTEIIEKRVAILVANFGSNSRFVSRYLFYRFLGA